MYKRGTLLIPSGPSSDVNRRHLHVICTDPDENGNQLIVSICTKINNLCDDACTLQEYEHPFLNHESYVFYRKAKIITSDALAKGVTERLFEPREDFNRQTFLRILKGICVSIQTPRKIKSFFGCEKE